MGMIRSKTAAALGVAAVLAVLAAGCGTSKDKTATTEPTKVGGGGTTVVSKQSSQNDALKLNQIQVIGTHNSFHVAPPADELAKLSALDAEQASQRTYTHPELATQLGKEKIRQIELDVFVDTKGGLYSHPALADPADTEPLGTDQAAMDAPGIKVLHEQDVDYHSVCPTLKACLTEVKTWSRKHPDHVPVAINIQFKDGPLIFDVPNQAVPEKWTTEQMDALDGEIRSVFDPKDLITPDDVRGTKKTLEESVLQGGWPTLGESRGKVMFLMINPEPYRSIYLQGHAGLKGRILFTNAEPGQPDASYVGLDDPIEDGARIKDLVAKGYLVRTRSDANGVEAKANDTERLKRALASGAQWVSTDYPGPDGAASPSSDFIAQLPGFLAARCNPIVAPEGCDDESVEPS